MKNLSFKKSSVIGLLSIIMVSGYSNFDRIARIFAPLGTTSGVVYRDIDGSGTKNGTEANVAGVTVNAYTASNATVPCGTTVSTTSGWTITSTTCTGALRIEFVLPTTSSTAINGITTNDYSGPAGGTAVQFVNDGATNVDFGLMNPDMYCGSTNPKMATPIYQAGGTNADRALTTWSYNNTGLTGDATTISTMGQIGSTWGLAYDKIRRQLYSAAVLKAHIPLGPEGLDAIYVTNPATGVSSKFVELQDDLGIAVSSTTAEPQYLTNAARLLNDTQPENDAQAFQDAGKVGLGDIDISTDGKLLYVVNLFDKRLYTIDIATKTLVGPGIPIPQPCAGTSRPWGLAVQNGQVFAGAVCENATTAAVYELVGSSFNTTAVLSFSLAYPREPGFTYGNPTCENNSGWKPWITGTTTPALCDGNKIIFATPILSDIEFDGAGNMVLGFTDRTGFQFADDNFGPTGTNLLQFNASGDILKACTTNGTTWSIEGTGTGCTSTTGGPGNNGGQAININDATGYNPSGAKPGEFFWGDYFHGDGDLNGNISWKPGHAEVTIGGLAILPGTTEVMSTAYDPVTGGLNYGTGGVISLSTTTGVRPRNGYQLYKTEITGADNATSGKGVGLGDLEILCDPAPIELGNRIWRDTDGDGIQDPGEAVLANVALELFVDANLDGIPDGPAIGTATTNTSGNYLFNAANVSDGDPTLAGNQPGPAPGTNYIIRVASADWSNGAGVGDLAGLGQTTSNVGGSGQADVRDSDATVVNSFLQISVTTGNMGESNHTLDIGLVPKVSIGSTVFIDGNNDGNQSGPAETGIPNATVKLYADSDGNGTPDGAEIATTITDSNGNYIFPNLNPGRYIVGVTPVTDYPTSSIITDTADNQQDGDDNGIQSASGAESFSPSINLTIGAEPTTEGAPGTGGAQDNNFIDANGDMTVDFGFYAPVSIGSTVFNDSNNNGTQDPTEVGLAGATVRLYDAMGVLVPGVMPQTTNASGNYYFSNLPPGNYIVGVTPPSTTPIISSTTDPADNQQDGDNNGGAQMSIGGESRSPVINLASNAEPTTEAGPGVGGAQDDATPVSDASGDMTVDFGFYTPVSIGSTVFFDADNDGIQDGTEVGIAGAVVTLYQADGTTPVSGVTPITTDGTGNYYFSNLAPGNYVVGVIPPSAFPTSSTPTVTTDENSSTAPGDGLDNGTQTNSGDEAKSPVISLAAGTEPTDASETAPGTGGAQDATADDAGDMTVDFGFFAPVSIGSTVFNDANNNGIFDGTESGLAGATVRLYFASGAPVPGVPSILTDGTGNYYFGNLPPGNYIVGVTPPPAINVSSSSTVTVDENSATNPGDNLDNGTQATPGAEAFSPVISLSAGTEPTGSTESGSNGGADDATGDASGDMTVDFGFYQPVSIGSTVFYDANNNGTQDASEVGIADAIVTLYNADGVTPVAGVMPITTNGTGNYFFPNLTPGTYVVGVKPSVLYPRSSTDISSTLGDNQIDGDDNGQQAMSGDEAKSSPILLTAGLEPTGTNENAPGLGGGQDTASGDNSGDMTIDFGFYAPVSIGSTVFNDINNNGTQDAGDLGIAGAIVTLYQANGTTPVPGVLPQTTDASGNYYFGGLPPGDYVVGVLPPTLYPASSTPTVTTDENNETAPGDGKDNGSQSIIGQEAKSPVITLAPGTEPTGSNELTQGVGGTQDDSTGDANGDMTVDFGFYQPVSIGSQVYFDNNNDGNYDTADGDAPLAGATVQLYDAMGNPARDANGVLVPAITTDGTGLYYFGNLLPGDYQVGVTPPASASASSSPTVISDDNGASDGQDHGTQTAPGTEALSPIITLTPNGEAIGETLPGGSSDDATNLDSFGDMSIDFGFYAPVSIGSLVYLDKANDGSFTIGTDTPLAGAIVTLYESDGITKAKDANGIELASITTMADGLYYFGNLLPGDYIVGVKPPLSAPTSSTTTVTTDDNGAGDGLDNGTQASSGDEAFSPVVSLTAGSEPTGESIAGGNQDDANALDSSGDMTVDFGFYPPLSLGSTAFIDLNNDGIQSGVGETGIDGLTVTLYQADGLTPVPGISPVVTAGGGNYVFNNLAPGTYVVGVSASSAYPNASTPVTNNSGLATDIDGVNTGTQAGGTGTVSKSGPINLAVGTQPATESGQGASALTAEDTNGNATIDFGFVPAMSIGSTAFIDLNNDGTQSGVGETGISGLIVNLYRGDGTTLVATTTTDMDGNYAFNNLLPGTYRVSMNAPAAYPLASTAVTANTGISTDIDGKNNGIQPSGPGSASLSGLITLTAGTQPTAEGAQGAAGLTATDANGNATIDFGFIPSVSLGSTAFIDLNNDGIQSGAGEVGIPDLEVTLYGPDGTTVVSTTVTDMNGNYVFNQLVPGTYIVGVKTDPNYPKASTAVTANSGVSADIDGRNNGTQTGGVGTESKSGAIVLSAGVQPTSETGQGASGLLSADANGNATIDFGFVPQLSLGSTAFIDLNNDGIQSGSGETGIDGLTVTLYAADGSTVIATTTTADGGHYFFNNLPPATYIVGMAAPTAYPVASTPVTANTGSTADIDGSNNGTQIGGMGESKSGPIALSAGTQPITDTQPGASGLTALNADGNATIDFGFFKPVNVSGTVFNDVNGAGNSGSTNGSVTDQPALQNPDLIANLVDDDGVVVATAPVNSSLGTFNFINVNPGTYTVVLTTIAGAGTVGMTAPSPSLPALYANTGEVNGAAGSDSGLTPDGTSAEFTVLGTDVPNINFGVQKIPAATDGSLTQANPGGTNQSGPAPLSAFGTDETPGIISSITFPTFPAGATSIVIGATTYTSGTWPMGGLTVPADAGFPVITVDPAADGTTSVPLDYTVTDNAGFTSPEPGTFTFNFTSPLPVNLLSFTANKVEKGVNLSWKVSAEKSFSHYEVERSSNAREFGQIARVNASGKSIYNSLDTKPMNGLNYYRLKMVDLDGTYKYSNLVSINNDTVQFMNLVNPAKGGEVSLTTNIENAKFVVTTTSGKTIPAKVQSLGAGKYKLSMSNTSTGMYIIHAMGAKGNLTRKVILE